MGSRRAGDASSQFALRFGFAIPPGRAEMKRQPFLGASRDKKDGCKPMKGRPVKKGEALMNLGRSQNELRLRLPL